MSRPLSRWKLLLVVSLAALIADQWTKYLAVDRLTHVFELHGVRSAGQKVSAFFTYRHLEPYATAPYPVLQPVWRMNYVENPGAAWGLFRGLSLGVRNAFFSLVSLGAVAFIVHYYRRLRDEQRYLQVALAFVLSGAVGNFLDRLARGYVIDFIEWYWWNRPDIRWPTFNLADSLIVVGVALLVIHPGHRRDAAGEGSVHAERRGA
jgi:signal peptidase II